MFTTNEEAVALLTGFDQQRGLIVTAQIDFMLDGFHISNIEAFDHPVLRPVLADCQIIMMILIHIECEAGFSACERYVAGNHRVEIPLAEAYKGRGCRNIQRYFCAL